MGRSGDADHQLELSRQLTGFLRRGCRVVLCGRPPIPDLPQATAITFDNTGGTMRLVEYLAGLGHRRIGYITGPLGQSTSRERLHGFRISARDHDPRGGWSRRARSPASRDGSRVETVAAQRHHRDRRGQRPVAAGALAAVRAEGRPVPQQVSVAGFDDIEFCQDTHPPLTTVRLPLRQAGATAGGIACGLAQPPAAGVIRLNADLVVRGTTGQVRE